MDECGLTWNFLTMLFFPRHSNFRFPVTTGVSVVSCCLTALAVPKSGNSERTALRYFGFATYREFPTDVFRNGIFPGRISSVFLERFTSAKNLQTSTTLKSSQNPSALDKASFYTDNCGKKSVWNLQAVWGPRSGPPARMS